MRLHPVLKGLGITAFMWVFFAAYFHLLRHPARPVVVMPLTALDHAIPFSPAAFWAYVSLWLYVSIAPCLLASVRSLLAYGAWVGALCLAGLAVFYLWPNAVPPPRLPPDLARQGGFAVLQGVDAAGNAFPSLHVATAIFTALWLQRLLREVAAPRWLRVLNWLWLVLIVLSTLAIKQHVVLDVLAGIALALLFAWPSLRYAPRGA